MPELPEVETVRRGLAPVMEGGLVNRLEQRRPDLRFPLPENFARRIEGHTIQHLGRRAKYLLAELDSNETLVMHLGMSGRFTIARNRQPRRKPGEFAIPAGDHGKHDHIAFHMAGGATVTYNDARRFGFMLLIPTADVHQHPLFRDLGVEPLGNSLSAAHLATLARGRKTDLKAFLLDQRTIAGLGNIYVSEALHRAGLKPTRPAATLVNRKGAPTDAAIRLVPEIKAVLEAAIRAGGSTLRDHRQTDGNLGYFQHTFVVYGRAGEACSRSGCNGTIKRIVQAGRSTFYCPKCQR